MRSQINKKILLYLFLFILLGTLNNKNINNFQFIDIKEIKVEGLSEDNNLRLLKNLDFLKFQNIFFINEKKIQKIITSNNLVLNYFVIKQYPSSLIVKISQTEFLAYTYKNGELFFIGSNGKLIKEKYDKKDLPIITGNFDNKDFLELKSIIDDTNFDYKSIKSFIFFPSKRWDLKTEDDVLIKLSQNRLKENLNLSVKILNNDQFQNIKIIDLRQDKQLIINE